MIFLASESVNEYARRFAKFPIKRKSFIVFVTRFLQAPQTSLVGRVSALQNHGWLPFHAPRFRDKRKIYREYSQYIPIMYMYATAQIASLSTNTIPKEGISRTRLATTGPPPAPRAKLRCCRAARAAGRIKYEIPARTFPPFGPVCVSRHAKPRLGNRLPVQAKHDSNVFSIASRHPPGVAERRKRSSPFTSLRRPAFFRLGFHD
jgi:hypothetical protein